MTARYSFILGLVGFLSLLLAGCDSESDEKVLLSFGGVGAYGDFDIHLPPDTYGRLAREGALLSEPFEYVPPVHPLGEVRSLSIRGHDIELESSTLQDGMLMTKDFGAIEFLIPREREIEMWGTQNQKDQIEDWLAAQ